MVIKNIKKNCFQVLNQWKKYDDIYKNGNENLESSKHYLHPMSKQYCSSLFPSVVSGLRSDNWSTNVLCSRIIDLIVNNHELFSLPGTQINFGSRNRISPVENMMCSTKPMGAILAQLSLWTSLSKVEIYKMLNSKKITGACLVAIWYPQALLQVLRCVNSLIPTHKT